MHNKYSLKAGFLIGAGTVFFFAFVYVLTMDLAAFLKTPSSFHRNIVGSYLSFFIPANLISWLALGQLGGILILIFSCFSIIVIVLKYGVGFYNIYTLLYGISAYAGYRFFLRAELFQNRCSAALESFEVGKNTLLADIARKEQDIESARNRVNRYMALKDITEDLSATLDLEKVAKLVVDGAFNIVGKSDRAFLFLIDEIRREMGLFVSRTSGGAEPEEAKKGGMFDNWILKQRKALIVEDIDSDFRFSADGLKDHSDRGFKSVIGVPLTIEKKIIGLLRMDAKKKAVYTHDDLRLLDIISDLAALAVENAVLYQKTNELAIKDGLTGLYVHRYFKERLGEEIKRALPARRKFSILMIDLDFFKECNDRYGHTAGDILLGKLAYALKTSVGTEHVVARYGGEEFSILLFDTGKKDALKTAQDIRKKIAASIFTLRRHEVKITVSVGVASFPEDGALGEKLLETADINLYKAKQGGRNRVC